MAIREFTDTFHFLRDTACDGKTDRMLAYAEAVIEGWKGEHRWYQAVFPDQIEAITALLDAFRSLRGAPVEGIEPVSAALVRNEKLVERRQIDVGEIPKTLIVRHDAPLSAAYGPKGEFMPDAIVCWQEVFVASEPRYMCPCCRTVVYFSSNWMEAPEFVVKMRRWPL